MMIDLLSFRKHFDHRYQITAKDIFQRVVLNLLKQEGASFGKEYAKYDSLYEALGPFEFEVYLQANIDELRDTIRERGFYPAILVAGDHNIQIYEARREALVESYKHPSLRYQDPFFRALFPTEFALVQEYVARYLKHGAADYDAALAQVIPEATGEWLVTEFTPAVAMEVLDGEVYRRYRHAQGEKVRKNQAKVLQRERLRATYECVLTTARRVLRNRYLDRVTIDTTALDAGTPMVVQVAPQLLELSGGKLPLEPFTFDTHAQTLHGQPAGGNPDDDTE